MRYKKVSSIIVSVLFSRGVRVDLDAFVDFRWNESKPVQMFCCIYSNLFIFKLNFIKFNLHNFDVLELEPLGQHKTPEFTKLNPMQKLPVLEDNGFVLTER